MDLRAQIPLAMVPLVIISIALVATWTVIDGGASVAPDADAWPGPMEDHPVVFLGTDPGSNPILDQVGRASTNITRSETLPALDLANTAYLVLIDGEWARKGDHRELISAVRSLILAGVPIVIVNGEPDIISKAIEGDQRIGFLTVTTSNPLRSAGIHYDGVSHNGQGYAYSSVDGDLGLAGMNAYVWCAQFL